MIKAGGAAVFHQLAHAGQGGIADDGLVQILPDLIERFQPVEKLHVLHLRQVAGELLVQMVVCIDQAGVAQQVGAVQLALRLLRQICADGGNSPALTVEINAVKQLVTVVAGDKGGNITNHKRGH